MLSQCCLNNSWTQALRLGVADYSSGIHQPGNAVYLAHKCAGFRVLFFLCFLISGRLLASSQDLPNFR